MVEDSIENIEARSQALHGGKEEQDAYNKMINDSIASIRC